MFERNHNVTNLKATRAQLLQRFDIDSLVKNMQEMTGNIMHAAVQEGALRGVELPPPELFTAGSSSLSEADGQPELETVSSPVRTAVDESDGTGKVRGTDKEKRGINEIAWVEVGKLKTEGSPRKLRSRKGK